MPIGATSDLRKGDTTLCPTRCASPSSVPGPPASTPPTSCSKSGHDVTIDLFERLPAPFGLVRYGVAPDHPRIKQIITALHKVLDRGDIRLLGNVDFGTDLNLGRPARSSTTP